MEPSTDALVGKRILVGSTFVTDDGSVARRVELHGVISKPPADGTLCFERADGGGEFTIPYDGQLAKADPRATYTLKTTGEAVTGVDHIATFEIHEPDEEA